METLHLQKKKKTLIKLEKNRHLFSDKKKKVQHIDHVSLWEYLKIVIAYYEHDQPACQPEFKVG